MEFPITYLVLLIWILLMLGLTDNYMRAILAFFGMIIGLTLTYEDFWLVFTYNYAQALYYGGSVLQSTFTTSTVTYSLLVISNVYDKYFGLIITALSIIIAFKMVWGIYQERKEEK